jgi:hypothetical protein
VPSAFLMRLRQNSQAIFNITVRSGTGPDLLTGVTLNFWLKAATVTVNGLVPAPDADLATVKLSTSTGEIVITDAINGLATLTIPPSAVATAGTYYGRLDAVVAGVATAVSWGPVDIAAS